MAAYKLPDDLSTAGIGELESFETIVFMELNRFRTELQANTGVKVTEEKLELIKALSADLSNIRAELANRSDEQEAQVATEKALNDAFSILDDKAQDADVAPTAELETESEPVSEEAPGVVEETLTETDGHDDAQTTEVSEEGETLEEVAASPKGADAPAHPSSVVNLTVNVSEGKVSLAADEVAEVKEGEETVPAPETLSEDPPDEEEAPAAETLADDAESVDSENETLEGSAPEADASESGEGPSDETVEAPEALAVDAPAEADAEQAEVAEAAETDVEPEALAEESAEQADEEDLPEQTLEDVSESTESTDTDEATEVLDDATATESETQDMPVSSDNEVEEMKETLDSDLIPTEVEASVGNATMNVAVDGMNYAAAATKGQVRDYSDVTKIFSTAFESLGGSNQWRGVRQGASDFIRLVTVEADETQRSFQLGLTNEANTATLEAATDAFVAKRNEDSYGALVASGGICAPCPVDFSLNRIAVAMNPIEASLPVVRAQRGCYAYTRRVNWTQAAREGIAVITPAMDAVGYVDTPGYAGGPGPTPNKPCVVVPCPDTDRRCCIQAIWWCMRIGNFQMITWPEHIDAFLQDLLVAFAAEKEANYLFEIDAASVVQFSNALGYNLRSNVAWILRNAMINYRKSLHLPLEGGARMTALIPDWLVEAIKQDYANSNNGLDSLSTADVDRWFRSFNLDPTYYYDTIACGDPEETMSQCKVDGSAVAEFPAEASIYFWNPGDVIRLFAGTLDFGMVRDHILNSTNDAILAAEEFTSLCIKEAPCKIVFPVCPSGALPPRAAAPVCGHNAAPAAFTPPAGTGNVGLCGAAEQDGPGSPCNDPANYTNIVCPPAPGPIP